MPAGKWTAEEIKDICAKRNTMSSRAIGAEYGVSHGSIIGVWKRARERGELPERIIRNQNGENAQSGQIDSRRVEALRAAAAAIVCEGVSLLDLKIGDCRFVTGRGSDGLSRFCGAFTGLAGSWCPDHRKRVFATDQGAAARALSVAY